MARRDLTALQLLILTRVSHGYTRDEIAADLNIARSTVNGHLQRVYDNLVATDAAHAVAEAFRRGLIE